MDPEPMTVVDFSNTEIAFSNKSDNELKKTARLFKLMNNRFLVSIGSQLGMWATKLNLPFTGKFVESTIFYLFCGGKTLVECQPVIDKLYKYKTLTVLDYGAEGKSAEDEIDLALKEILKGVEFAGANDSVPVVSVKPTALAENELLENWQSDTPLNGEEQQAFERVMNRMDVLCSTAHEHGVKVFVDAEESWMQDTIDFMVDVQMAKHNKESAIVYNTYQMYRTDMLDNLKQAYAKAQSNGYILGAKLVRGAYMNKERSRADEMGYPSPIQPNKETTDRDYNAAVRFCVDHYEEIASCNASHNLKSNLLQAELIAERDLPRGHPHLNFCQLMGMSDFVTFNLSAAGFNVAKYVVYGPIKEVVPYLVRRAQENTSITGEMSRELKLIVKEVNRRGI